MIKLPPSTGPRVALALAGLTIPSLRRDEGQTFVEYAMILALIAVAMVAALTFLHDQIDAKYSFIANRIP